MCGLLMMMILYRDRGAGEWVGGSFSVGCLECDADEAYCLLALRHH
jgi:hypothetical protein